MEFIGYQIGDAEMRLYAAGITRLPVPVEAVVSSDDERLTGSGGVSKAIRLAAGTGLERQVREMLRELERHREPPTVGQVIVTGAGNLDARYVFHIITIAGMLRIEPATLTESLARCFFLAAEKGLASIAFPAIGTGAAGFSAQQAAGIIVTSIARYFASGHSPIKHVFLAVPDPDVRAEFDIQLTRVKMLGLAQGMSLRQKVRLNVAIVFTDIVGSTAYFEQMGDDLGLEMLDRHNKILLPLIPANGGHVIKTMGDGVLACFSDAISAVNYANQSMLSLTESNRDTDLQRQISIRVGIHYGEVINQLGDLFGDAVNLAQRVQSLAEPGQVLATEAVFCQPGIRAVHFREIGIRSVKGKSRPIKVFEIEWHKGIMH